MKKFFTNIWDLFYKILYFFKNIWMWKKVLWNYRWYDYHFVLESLYTAIYIMANNTEKYGNELESHRSKKVAQMRRLLELIQNKMNDNFIERSEIILGEKIPQKDFNFIPSETHPNCYELVDDDTPEEKKLKKKIYHFSDKLEDDEWNEMWAIIKGKNIKEYKKWLTLNKDLYTQEQIDNADAYNDWNNGYGLKTWWS